MRIEPLFNDISYTNKAFPFFSKYLDAGETSVAAAAAELASPSKVLNDSIDMPSCALITVCCIVLPPLKDSPIFRFNGFVFILLILNIADGF